MNQADLKSMTPSPGKFRLLDAAFETDVLYDDVQRGRNWFSESQ